MADRRFPRDPARPCFVISVAAGIVQAHPRTLRIYEDEGLLAPARTPTNIRLYSENDIRRILWIRRLTQERGVNLAGVKLLFELEERLGVRLLEALFDEDHAREAGAAAGAAATAAAAAREGARDGDGKNSAPASGPNGSGRSEASSSSDFTDTKSGAPDVTSVETETYAAGSNGGRSAGQAEGAGLPVHRPITRIVATRVTTSDRKAITNRSGDSNV
jgi:MerR family transcriptional regulator/heat shock protein HspR